MNDTIDPLLLDRYRAGECTLAERMYVERWAAADPEHAKVLDWMRSLEAAAAAFPDPWDQRRLWARVRAQLDGAASMPAAGERRPTRTVDVAMASSPSWTRRWLRAAAVIGGVAVGAVLWRSGHRTSSPDGRVEALRTFATGAGERATVWLGDGSQVVIDAGSTLQVPATFGRLDRDVRLEGRAYFAVAHDSSKPFRVHSHYAVTRVLGTRFGVRAYPEDSAVTVAVREGRVAVVAARQSATAVNGGVVLEAGDAATVGTAGPPVVERGADVDRYLAWTSGRLEFMNTPLRTVIPELARRYGLEIVTPDRHLDSLVWTATLRGEPAAEVLQMLAASLELEVVRRGDRVVLRLLSSKR